MNTYLYLSNYEIAQQLLVLFLSRFFLAISVIGLAVGFVLLLKPALMQPVSSFLNRWVSTRQNTKWLNVPRDTAPLVRRFRVPIGVVFVVVASYSLYMLITRVDPARLAVLLKLNASRETVVWLFESFYWLMIVGDLIAIVAGVLMVFFPKVFHAIEARADRWYSVRHASAGLEPDAVHLGIERGVARFPRTAGAAIAALSLGAMASNWVLLRSLV